MNQRSILFYGLYGVILLLGYLFLGWLLAAFQVSWLVWLGTLGVTLHLIRVGTAAIPLASGWAGLVMFVAAVKKAWTPVWNSNLPYERAQDWAWGLLLIWFGSTGLVALLALAPTTVTRLGLKGKAAFYSLLAMIWGALGIGCFLYRATA